MFLYSFLLRFYKSDKHSEEGSNPPNHLDTALKTGPFISVPLTRFITTHGHKDKNHFKNQKKKKKY